MGKRIKVSALNCFRQWIDNAFADLLPYTSDMKTTRTFLCATLDLILQYLAETNEHDSPVSDGSVLRWVIFGRRRLCRLSRMVFVRPTSIGRCLPSKSMMKALIYTRSLPTASASSRQPSGQVIESVLAPCSVDRKHRCLVGHPRFINQLTQGVDIVSLVGDVITSSINANMFTYEVAPVFNLMEESVLTHMRHFCGWSSPDSASGNGDGVLAPGGAVSNLYAVLAARHSAFPEIKASGIRNSLRPAMIISKHVRIDLLSLNGLFVCIQCHYSIEQAAALLGIGTDHVYEVDPDHS